MARSEQENIPEVLYLLKSLDKHFKYFAEVYDGDIVCVYRTHYHLFGSSTVIYKRRTSWKPENLVHTIEGDKARRLFYRTKVLHDIAGRDSEFTKGEID